MRHYTQLTEHQRYQIQALMKAEHTQTAIADIIGVHKATVSREVRRNRGLRGYRPKQAQQLADNRREHSQQPRIADSTWHLVERWLRDEWSPEQISDALRCRHGIRLSHEWIYQYVLHDKASGGDLYRHLRCQKRRRKRYGSYSRRCQLVNTVSIEERPAIVDCKSRLGDWEVDTVIGQGYRQALVTLTERRSMYTLLGHVQCRTANAVRVAIVRLLRSLKGPVHTITSDNGKEFAEHETISEVLDTSFYFAHPYASWERGLNENINGLIRQYFPKKMDFSTITKEQVKRVMNKLNNRPRKTLGYRTPHEVFFNINVALQN
ncbi:IS30 family transposase [Methylohalomonas lacus]|uniref:IS30 family transposase n=1 Tax=Methylohalomonas lacus TaxID=398773 RepID=A0AAE3HKJ4_9GAMM|nr:IS30 family transposase [Methylohalomonas lacus]MCS3903934.1 IS30 family transposase [Methylohalomonas lacus]